VNDSGVRVAAGVHRQKVSIPRDEHAVFSQSKRQYLLGIVGAEKIRVGKRQHIIATKRQGRGDRMVNVFVDEKSDVHAEKS
jgi:hypothetical protein